MILASQEKEQLVIKLASQGKSTRFIAKAAHISHKDIGIIVRRYNTGKENAATAKTDKSMSINYGAFKLFKENKNLVDVAITLNIEADKILDLHSDNLRLTSMDKLKSMYIEMGDEIHLLTRPCRELKWHGLANPNDISNIMQHEEKLRILIRSV